MRITTETTIVAMNVHRVSAIWLVGTGLLLVVPPPLVVPSPLLAQNHPSIVAGETPPNIVLVMSDDQGFGDTGYAGHPELKTPHLDAMARVSVVFQQFHAGAPVCSPTRASVLTGRTPMRTNVTNHGHYLRPDEVTLAEALRSRGYATGHFGKWHIGSVQAESPTCPGQQGFDEWLSGLNFFDRDPYLSDRGTFRQLRGQGTELTMDAALRFIRKHALADHPSFTVIWFPAPHAPHRETSSHPEWYADQMHRAYFQEISLVDEQIGRLRTTLRELSIADRTLVWFCSDNGGLVHDSAGGRARKGSVYEGGLRVPALLEWPARWQHRVVSAPASTCDIYPTVLALTQTNLARQPKLDGIDLTAIIDGQQQRRSKPIGFWHGFAPGEPTRSDQIIRALMEAQLSAQPTPFPDRLLKDVENSPHFEPFDGQHYPGHAAWLDWPFKIHIIADRAEDQAAFQVRYELYDLEHDPMEQHDVKQEHRERFARMKQQLADWQHSVIRSLNRQESSSKPSGSEPSPTGDPRDEAGGDARS